MKKIAVRVLMFIIILLVVVVAGGLTYVKYLLPNVSPPPEISIELTPERVAHGEYLANHVFLCMDCHSERDWSKFSAPPIHGTEGSGGDEFTQEMGFPGHYYATNITPAGIGDWTDGEILRAITTGVSKDGRALFPIMPYPYLGKADKEDVYSVIAYLRTLDPIQKDFPSPESDFPFNFIINLIPAEASFMKAVDRSDKLALGEYLSWSCIECHTMDEKGQIIPEKAFQGGRAFPLPNGGTVYSANLTPDKKNGIGKWTEEQFIHKFKQYLDSSFVLADVPPNGFNTYMPWVMYAGMDKKDLSAIYAYLTSLEPVEAISASAHTRRSR